LHAPFRSAAWSPRRWSALRGRARRLRRHRRRGKPGRARCLQGSHRKGRVQHKAQLLAASNGTAVVFDAYTDSSYYVSLSSGQIDEPRPTPQTVPVVYGFKNDDGVWKASGEQRLHNPEGAASPTEDIPSDQLIPLQPALAIDPGLVTTLKHAYWLYWQRDAEALATLDASPMKNVGDETQVDGTTKSIEQFRNDGHRVRLEATHDAQLLSASDGEAFIYDFTVDSSYYVSLTTSEVETPKPSTETFRRIIKLSKVDNTWKRIQAAGTPSTID
jgi:hypothetical protein